MTFVNGSPRKNASKRSGNPSIPTSSDSCIGSTTRSEGKSSSPKSKQASANVPSSSRKSSYSRNLSETDYYFVSSRSLPVDHEYNTTTAGAYPSEQERLLLGVGAQFLDGSYSKPSMESQERVNHMSLRSGYASPMERYLSQSKREDPWNAVGAQDSRDQ